MKYAMDNENMNNGLINIKVVGVGGGGGNAINRMITDNMGDVEYIAINTDQQVLVKSLAQNRISIGQQLTAGRGAGGDPECGAHSAEESRDEITQALKGAEMVFITAGMGGGTGTGASPIVAEIAQKMGILTVAVVTKPFHFEGKPRMRKAEQGIANLYKNVDALIVIPNERLVEIAKAERGGKSLPFNKAFEMADDVLRQGVQSIAQLIKDDGFVNLDFADVSAVLRHSGYAHMGVGTASGDDRAINAAKAAVSSPLLETKIDGASALIMNINASYNFGMDEGSTASDYISSLVSEDCNIYWGVVFDENMGDEIKITVIATGFKDKEIEALDEVEAKLVRGTKETMKSARKAAGVETPQQKKPAAKPERKSSTEQDIDAILAVFREGNK